MILVVMEKETLDIHDDEEFYTLTRDGESTEHLLMDHSSSCIHRKVKPIRT